MDAGPISLPGQIAVLLLGPPIMATMCYLLSRAWAGVLGTTRSPRVQGWTRAGFWIVMGGGYAIGAALFVYAYFIR